MTLFFSGEDRSLEVGQGYAQDTQLADSKSGLESGF